MIAGLKSALRRWVLTHDEQQLLSDSPRAVWRQRILRKFLNADQIAVMDMMEKVERCQPVEPLQPSEAADWGGVLRSPVGSKIDVIMCNMCAEQAQQAVHTPSAEVVRMAGFAAGFRASWVMAKSISTIAGTDAGKSEDDGSTGAHPLEHLNP